MKRKYFLLILSILCLSAFCFGCSSSKQTLGIPLNPGATNEEESIIIHSISVSPIVENAEIAEISGKHGQQRYSVSISIWLSESTALDSLTLMAYGEKVPLSKSDSWLDGEKSGPSVSFLMFAEDETHLFNELSGFYFVQ